MRKIVLFSALIFTFTLNADLKNSLDEEINSLMEKVIEWRHDIHEHPELGNREFRTSKKLKIILFHLEFKLKLKSLTRAL